MRYRIALFFWQSEGNATLSYQHGWPRALNESSLLECEMFNLARRSIADVAGMALALQRGHFDAIVMLHSVFSNTQELRRLLFLLVATSRLPKLYFIGNEYKLMPEKMSFCRRLGVDALISQSNDLRVHALYREALGCEVTCIPNTGFDPSVFAPHISLADRKIDIGYRAYEAPWYLGNIEKTEIAEIFSARATQYGLNIDISLNESKRLDSRGYADFLNKCFAQIGTESGGDFFELTDSTRRSVNRYVKDHPNATWNEVKRKVFDTYDEGAVPIRIISGRQVEAAACKSVQVLMEGRYNDIFVANQHYIPLCKDYSNFKEVVEKLRDKELCQSIADSAYSTVMQELTYPALVKKLISVVKGML